jgi:hypothetical protein
MLCGFGYILFFLYKISQKLRIPINSFPKNIQDYIFPKKFRSCYNQKIRSGGTGNMMNSIEIQVNGVHLLE